MKRIKSLSIVAFSACASLALAQTKPAEKTQIAPGFLLRPVGVIDIGNAYVEINYYDAKWVISQQHDKFAPKTTAAAPGQPTVISGVLTTAGGPANYVETLTPEPDGLRLQASLTSDTPLATNEISMTYILPLSTFGGKQMKVDGDAVELPMTPAAKGMARVYGKEGVHRLEIPTPTGTLTITGDFKLLLNDDREWNDPRFSLRLGFTPSSGSVRESKIDLHMTLTPMSTTQPTPTP